MGARRREQASTMVGNFATVRKSLSGHPKHFTRFRRARVVGCATLCIRKLTI